MTLMHLQLTLLKVRCILLYILYFVIRDSNSNNKNIKAQKKQTYNKKKNYQTTKKLQNYIQ